MMKRKSRGATAPAEQSTYAHPAYDSEQVQSLLAALADLDAAYESDVATVRASDVPEVLKQEVIRTLQRHHKERRASYLQQREVFNARGRIRT